MQLRLFHLKVTKNRYRDLFRLQELLLLFHYFLRKWLV
jgi:hypothetical protein